MKASSILISNGLLCRNWLRSALFLVIVMGVTWIFGVLIVEVEELVPLAYIYTILVAFQGLFIFLIFVVFSKQVREAYTKCWRTKIRSSDFFSKYLSSNKHNFQVSIIYYDLCYYDVVPLYRILTPMVVKP